MCAHFSGFYHPHTCMNKAVKSMRLCMYEWVCVCSTIIIIIISRSLPLSLPTPSVFLPLALFTWLLFFFCTCFTLRAVFIAVVFAAAAFYSLDSFLPPPPSPMLYHAVFPPPPLLSSSLLSFRRSPIIFHAQTHTSTHTCMYVHAHWLAFVALCGSQNARLPLFTWKLSYFQRNLNERKPTEIRKQAWKSFIYYLYLWC